MNKMTALLGAILLLAIATVTWTTIAATTEAEAGIRPSILLINTDDQRADTLGYMPLLSARIEAEKPWVFTHAYVTNPICCPSRSELMVGQFPDGQITNPVYRNDPPNGGPSRLPTDSLLPQRMQELGYETIVGGKWFNQWRNVGPLIPPYWDHAFINLSLTFNPFNLLTGEGSPRGEFLDGQTKWIREHETTHVIDRLVDLLRGEHDHPLFIYFAPFSPHLPSGVPDDAPFVVADPSDLTDDPRSRQVEKQIRSIAWLDGEVNRLIESVRSVDPNTIVIFTSDNGMMWGEKGLFGKAKPYEGSVEVPLVVFDPADQGETVVTGVNAPAVINQTAQSLAPDITSKPLYFYSFYKVDDFGVPAWRSVRREIGGVVYKLIEFGDGRTEFYNLNADPGENNALDSEPPSEISGALVNFKVPIILDDALPDARLRRAYAHQLRTWDPSAQCWLFSGKLPPGAYLRPDCRLGGTPLKLGEYTFVVELRPERGRDFSYYEEFSIVVNEISPD